MNIRMFGNLSVTVAGSPVSALHTPRLHSLLAWLILHDSAPQSKELVAAVLWPESNGAQARTNLRQLMHHLRRALPPECNSLRGDRATVFWQHDPQCSIDTLQFEAAIAAAVEARQRNDANGESRHLQRAAALYADDLLPAVYDTWLLPFRQALKSQLSGAIHRLATLNAEAGDLPAAIGWAEQLIAHDLSIESNYQLLMKLHLARRDRASALRTFHQLRSLLRRELGVAPGPDTLALFEQVLRSDKPMAVVPPARNAEGEQKRALVGRGLEQRSLQEAWHALTRGSPRALIISGEPGIGKTRLAEELLQWVQAAGNAVLRGRCYSSRGQVAYAPVAEWLRSEALRSQWPRLTMLERSELSRIVPEIREASMLPNDPAAATESWQRAKLYNALSTAIRVCTDPVLLFIDDLQWCDPDSLEWISVFLRSKPAQKILLVGTVRAEETERDHPFTSFLLQLRQAEIAFEIPLKPLDENETSDLATQEASEALVDARLQEIYRSTRGNPLFVLESVRSGLQHEKVHGVIRARLANLTAAAYELAGLASVVARPFSLELLEKATDWDERSLTLALDELWQRRIVESRGSAAYDFSHDRVRDVARAELSVVQRRYFHRRVARALVELHQEDSQEWNGQIAFHYEQAGMAEQAVAFLYSAADSARTRFAYSEAAGLLRRALEVCSELPSSNRNSEQKLDLLLLLGTVLVATTAYSSPAVGTVYGNALALARSLRSKKVLACLSGLWVFHAVAGNVETSRQEALEFLQRAEEEQGEAATELSLSGHFLLGSSLSHLGQIEQSWHHLTLALGARSDAAHAALEVLGGSDIRVFCRAYLSHVAWHRSVVSVESSACALSDEAIAIASRMRHPFIEAIALDYAAILHTLRGDTARVLKLGTKAIQLCSENDFAYYLAMARLLTAWAMSLEGDPTAGLQLFRTGLDSLRQLGAELRLPFYYALLAECYLRAGLVSEASASLSSGFAFASKNAERWALPELHRVQGDLLFAEGRLKQAAHSYRQGLAVAEHCGSAALAQRLSGCLERTQGALSAERF